MCQADKTDADDFPHHQVEWLDGRNHHFDDTVRLFFHHSLHDHPTVHDDKHIDNEGQYHTQDRGNLGRSAFLASVFIPFDGLDIEIDFAVLDDLFQVVYIVRGEFLVFQVFRQRFVDRIFQSYRNLLLRVECCGGRILQQIVCYIQECEYFLIRIFTIFFQAGTFFGDESVFFRVFEQRGVFACRIDDRHLLGIISFDGG